MKHIYLLLSLLACSLFGNVHAQQNAISVSKSLSVSSGGTETNNPSNEQDLFQQNNFVTYATPIWGAGASVGNAYGEFTNAFIQAGTFSPGDNTTSWTALSVYDTGNSRTPGNAYWTRSTLGYSQGAYWNGTTPVASPSAANGVAIFDSDFLDNGGTAGAFGSGTSPDSQKGELISPRIDLTGYTDQAVMVEFFSFFRNFQINELSVSLSTDDGTTWTTQDFRSLTADETEETVRVIFANATAGVNNLTQCRIKFTFDGYYYFAIVDDVNIKPATDADLTIFALNTGNITGLDYGDQVHITGNRFFPIGQIIQDARHISFGANVINVGAVAADISESPALNLLVERGDDVNGWVTVHTQSVSATQSIDPNTGVSLTGILDDTTWMTVGSYRATYTAAYTGTDADN